MRSGVETGHQRRDDADAAIDDVERQMKAMLGGLARRDLERVISISRRSRRWSEAVSPGSPSIGSYGYSSCSVPEKYSFWDLHVAIQDAMGWLDYHLHEFRFSMRLSGT